MDYEIEYKELIYCKCCGKQLKGSELAQGNTEQVCNACEYNDRQN